MARKKPKPESSNQATTDTRESVRTVVLAKSRDLVTISPEHAIWTNTIDTITIPKIRAGAIVRLKPPAEATDEMIAGLRRLCELRGATRVFTLPRPKAETVPAKARARVAAVGARTAVHALVAESNTKDRVALGDLCERVMSEVGL